VLYLRTTRIDRVFRYDLLCIEGIARALRVFLGKGEAPEYRLVYPPGGEKNIIEVTVAPEASWIQWLFSFSDGVSDSSSSPLLRLGRPSQCQLHATLVRVVYRFTRQVTPEHLPEATVRRHRHTRLGYNHGAVPLPGKATQGHQICPSEQNTSTHC
jgi:hypothetical protein